MSSTEQVSGQTEEPPRWDDSHDPGRSVLQVRWPVVRESTVRCLHIRRSTSRQPHQRTAVHRWCRFRLGRAESRISREPFSWPVASASRPGSHQSGLRLPAAQSQRGSVYRSRAGAGHVDPYRWPIGAPLQRDADSALDFIAYINKPSESVSA